MTIGSLSARADSGASIPQKLLSILLACVLAVSLVPSPAWASDGEADDTSTASAEEKATVQPVDDPTTDDAVSLDAPLDASQNDSLSSSPDGEIVESPDEEPAIADPVGSELDRPVALSAEEPPASDGSDVAAEAATVTALDDESYIIIQDSADETDEYERTKDTKIKVGQTMYANAYDGASYSDNRIPAQSGWSYQWLAGNEKSDPDSAYVPIAGQTGPSLTVTEDLLDQVVGKYIRVKVTGDGQVLYGPGSWLSTPASSATYTPGPVVADGAITVSNVVLAYNGADFGSDYESVPDAHVGDVIKAAAYDSEDPSTMYYGDKVDFSWQVAESADGEFREVFVGDTYTVGSFAGKYLKVVATAKDGGSSHATEAGRILAEGVYTLVSASVTKTSSTTPTTLTASAFTGDYYSQTKVDNKYVSYTWEVCKTNPIYGSDKTWTVKKVGAKGDDRLELTDADGACWVRVKADAGDNTTGPSSSVGPIKPVGVYDIKLALFSNVTDGDVESNYYKVGDTIGLHVYESTEANMKGGLIPVESLACTWKVADAANGTFTELTDGNAHKASFEITEAYQGKYLTCEVSAGVDTYELHVTKQIAAASALSVSKVELTNSDANGRVIPGSTLSAHAYDSAGKDITSEVLSAGLSFAWYTSEYASGSSPRRITGAQDASFSVTNENAMALKDKYLVATIVDERGADVSGVTGVKVSVPNAVRLYSVSVDNAVSGKPTVGVPLTATVKKGTGASNAVELGSDDAVSYQWQYTSIANTTSDSRFYDIAGATSSVYVPTATMKNKYLRVVVTSQNEIASTKFTRPYVYAIGPVSEPSVTYDLSSVALSSDAEGYRVGATLLPFPKYQEGEFEKTVPSDAYVGYTWYSSDNADGTNAKELSGFDAKTGALKLARGLEGSYVFVEANALGSPAKSTPVKVVAGALSATVKVTGISERDSDGQYSLEDWIPLTEYEWQSDKNVSAWDVFSELLQRAYYSYSLQDGWVPYSITPPGGVPLAAEHLGGYNYNYWSFKVNGTFASSYPTGYKLQDGDTIELVYLVNDGSEKPSDIEIVPDAPRPDYDDSAAWPGYAGGSASGPSTDAKTPVDTTDLAWSSALKDSSEYSKGVSDPILVNGDVYIAAGNTLYIKDAATGETKKQATLAVSINTTSRIVYADGLIVVPLSGGRLQALTADDLVTVWLTDELPAHMTGGSQQSLTTLTVRDGCVYYGTAAADWTTSYGGYYLCVDLATGETKWINKNSDAGYYWSGAASAGSYLVVADDNGVVRALDPASGDVVASLDLGVRVRSTVIADADGTTLYVVSNDGVLHKLSVAADGALTHAGSVKFGSSSTSTPSLTSNGKIVACGSSTEGYNNDWGGISYYGVIAVIDAATMTLENRVDRVDDGSWLPADAKSAPVIAQVNGETYAYFTCNSVPGGVYQYRLGDTSAGLIYHPEGTLANYCMASVAVGADGTLYYTNDSGYLIALKHSSKIRVTFDSKGGTIVGVSFVAPNEKVSAPADPVREGYTFTGWFVDEGCTKAWDFDAPVTGAMTLHAKWDKKQDGNEGGDDNKHDPEQPGGDDHEQGGSSNGGADDPQDSPAPYAKPLPAGGAPAATHAPLTQESAKTDDDKQETEKKADQKADASTRSEDRAKATSAGVDADTGAGEQHDGVNPWAMGGVALGVIGLIGATVYVVRTRRRNGEAS